MKTDLNIQTIIQQDEDGIFVASCPAIPGCHTQGSTYEEAVKNIEEAIRLCLKVAENDSGYKSRIQASQIEKPTFIGISNIFISRPSFL